VWQTLHRGIDDVPATLAVTVRVRDEILALVLRVHQADLAPSAVAAPPEPVAAPPEPGGEPGWTTVELRFRSLYAAEALLAFGPDLEVLSPEELRLVLARKSEATAALYRGCDASTGQGHLDRTGG
jgi:predicted DNA-binding transcriptional regulator YafY